MILLDSPLYTIAAACGIIFCSAGCFSVVPWVPTRRRERELLLKEVTILPGQVVYDLGAGTGTVMFLLAKREPNARYVGIEIAPLLVIIGFVKKLIIGAAARNVSLRLRDLFAPSYADGDVLFIFLLNTAYPKLIKKLRGTLKPEATVIVEAWPLPNMVPQRILRAEGATPLYVYRGSQFN
jgi:SAM-dependent methyltransferase